MLAGRSDHRGSIDYSGCDTRYAVTPLGNSTIASPVATFSPAWFLTMTSIRTQREWAVTCFDFTIPVGWMVSPGRTGLTHFVSRRRWMAPAG
jgi:hypothetical protein